jgi:hypothetical protein
MISILNLMIFTSFLVFAIIVVIPTAFEIVFAQEKEEAEQSQSLPLLPTLDDNNKDIIISEEICPPYCSPPPPIQELPQEQSS